MFSFSLFSRVFSRAWEFLFNLGIFRDNILGFLKIQSGTTSPLPSGERRELGVGAARENQFELRSQRESTNSRYKNILIHVVENEV